MRELPKKSWKVSLPDGNQFDDNEWGCKRGTLNINAEYADSSLMREKLTYDLMAEMGLLASRTRFVKFYVNDRYYGLHTDVENPRRGWLEQFGYIADGPMYKASGSRMYAFPTVEEYEDGFDKQLREEEPFDDLAQFLGELNSWPPEDVNAQFNAWLDVGQLSKYMVANCLVRMTDHIEANFLLYQDTAATNKWVIIPWDHDRTWGKHWDDELGLFSNEIVWETRLDYGSFRDGGTSWGNVLLDSYLNDPQFLAEYHASLLTAVETYLDEGSAIARIDEYEALITPAVLADPNKWGTNEDYPLRIEDLRNFVRLRHEFIEDELADS